MFTLTKLEGIVFVGILFAGLLLYSYFSKTKVIDIKKDDRDREDEPDILMTSSKRIVFRRIMGWF